MKITNGLFCCFIVCVNATAYAEVVTDGTMGAVQNLAGQMQIPQDLGKTAGNNLFHSFQTFNIQTGESATFTGSNSIQNIISRVTGGQISSIDGLLKSEISNANFYFINPAGVTFGANASIDVPAAFHVSTADNLRFADGKEFSATNPTASSLSIAEPASFGFLDSLSATITVNGSQLAVKKGKILDLVARNINVNSITEETNYGSCNEFRCLNIANIFIYPAYLSAPSGEVRLVALNGQGTVSLKQDSFGKLALPTTMPLIANAGSITIDSSIISSDGNGSGHVALWGNEIHLQNQAAAVTANNSGNLDASSAKGIEIQANSLDVNNLATIAANAFSSGKGGDITVQANSINISQGGQIGSAIYSSGKGGDVNINTKTLTLTDKDSQIGAVNLSNSGTAGDVNINAQDIKILNGSRITTQMQAQDANAFNTNESVGNGGNIHIKAQTLTLDGQQTTDRYASITSIVWPIFGRSIPWIHGRGGNITIAADTLDLLNLSDISTTSLSSGVVGGNIDITANALKIDGKLAGIHAGTYRNGGDSGNINVVAKTVEILHNGAIVADSVSNGSAGNISITADSIEINGLGDGNNIPTGITTNTFGMGGDDNGLNPLLLSTGSESQGAFMSETAGGNSGNVNINTRTLDMQNGGLISSALVNGWGSPGKIAINATEQIQLAGNSQITNRSETVLGLHLNYHYINGNFLSVVAWGGYYGQPAGEIVLNAPKITLDNSKIDSNTTNFINAGDISLQTESLALLNGSAISSSTSNSYGDAGKISINGSDKVLLQQSSVNTSSTGGGRGGDVEVVTATLTLDNHASILATSKSLAPSGNISLIAPMIEVLNNSSVTAENSGSGVAGTIDISQNNNLLRLSNNSVISTDFSAIDDDGYRPSKFPLTTEEFLTGFGRNPVSLVAAKMLTNFYSSGIAGDILINTKTLDIAGGSRISSQTDANGSAGTVSIVASDLLLNNSAISAAATNKSGGQTGDINVTAKNLLQLVNQSKITIQNNATVFDPATIKTGIITVFAPDIDLKDSKITAESIGNVDASNVLIHFSVKLTMDPSFITTSANLGNGGNITINGGQLISLQNSGFLTSVIGANGNGGNINVTANSLIMNNGVIQANAVGGSGGDINLNLQALIPSYDQLIKGGAQVVWRPFQDGFNVIQAASQNGINGSINISSPQFSISGSMGDLNSSLAIPILDSNPCLSSAAFTSSLARIGKGGVSANEAKTVFVPAIAEHTNANLHSQTDSTKQKSLSSNKLIEQEKHPCMAISLE